MQPMLGHNHTGRRQLRHLVAGRLAGINTLRQLEHVRAGLAPLRPMLDNLVDLLRRQQPPMLTLMPRLPATRTTRTLPSRPRRRRRRILRRRQRRVPRAPVQTPLKLTHPRLKPPVRLHQLTQPQQEQDRRLTVTIKDRLSLNPLHTTKFAAPTEVPSWGERL